jgi:hypothetical protein
MRRLFAVSAVVVLIGGSATYALVGRHASRTAVATRSAVEAPRVETARLFSAPISSPSEPDLIATKLMAEVAWPEVRKPIAKMTPAKLAATPAKVAAARQVKSRPNPKPHPKPKKQVANATGSR